MKVQLTIVTEITQACSICLPTPQGRGVSACICVFISLCVVSGWMKVSELVSGLCVCVCACIAQPGSGACWARVRRGHHSGCVTDSVARGVLDLSLTGSAGWFLGACGPLNFCGPSAIPTTTTATHTHFLFCYSTYNVITQIEMNK